MSRAISMCWSKNNTVTREDWNRMTQGSRVSVLDDILAHRKVPTSFYSNMRNRKRVEQGMLATRLCELAGVATNRQCNLNDIPSFENLLDIDIFVVGAQQGNKFIRVPSRNDAESTRQRVYLYFDGSREGVTITELLASRVCFGVLIFAKPVYNRTVYGENTSVT